MINQPFNTTLYSFIFTVIFIQLLGCGGGGGGSSSDSLTYSGATSAAVITLDNATTLVANVLYATDVSTNMPSAISMTDETARSSGAVIQSDILRKLSNHLTQDIFSLSNIATGIEINEPLFCESGSANLSGTLNDSTGTGTLSFVFNNCLLEGVTYNGTGTFRVDAIDLMFGDVTDATMTFNLLSIVSTEFTGSISGTLRIQHIIGTLTEQTTLNYVSKDNTTGKMYKFENTVISTSIVIGTHDQWETYIGNPARAYDSTHGYVDVITTTPMTFSSSMLAYPDLDGVILFTGAANTSIRLTVLSSEHLLLELDTDGSPSYEVTRILLWSDLAVSSNTDLTDTDNDGMHDSWETDNNLDPLNNTDADQDADGDGFSNIEEYLGGTDPNLASSFPLSADLSITKTDSADPVVAGTPFSYELIVSNAGPATGDNILVQDTLPPGLTFDSATGTGWSCSHLNGVVSCTRSSLSIGLAPAITIVVDAPLTSDSISNTASVSSNTIDTNSSNDSTIETTAIEVPANSFNIDFGAQTFDMELDTARQLLYVSVPSQNEIAVVSMNTFTVANRVIVGPGPYGIDLSKDGNTLYIALNQGGSVALLNLNSLQVSELHIGVELGTSLTYDVIAATATEVFASGSPGGSGFAYIVKIDTANSNSVSRVANNRIIRATPFFVASEDQQNLYIGEGFSPNSVYKLDLTQNDAPIVLEDNHGSILFGGIEHLAINQDGSRLFLASGQVLRTDTLTQAGLIGRGVSTVSTDGTKVYSGKAPNSISVYNVSTFLEIDNILTTCDITDIDRIIEVQADTEWILLGQHTVCRVELASTP